MATTKNKPGRKPKLSNVEVGGAAPAEKPKTSKPRGAKQFAFCRVGDDGAAGTIQGPFASEAQVMDELALAGGDSTVVIFREVKRGKLKTKVRVG